MARQRIIIIIRKGIRFVIKKKSIFTQKSRKGGEFSGK